MDLRLIIQEESLPLMLVGAIEEKSSATKSDEPFYQDQSMLQVQVKVMKFVF